ncbi:thiolase, partial [Helicosporidium sp. ATCC 50920]
MHLESAAMATNGIQASQTAAFSSSARSGASDDLPPGVYIVGAKRTPMGAFQGALSGLKAPELGSVAIRGALEQARVSPDQVSEVVMGNVCSAGVGQAPARQASLGASLPVSVDCTTVNKVCSSGMKAVTMGAQSILCGTAEVVVAGGMESMSNVPYYAPTLRGGARLGHSTLVDGVIADGLWDARHDVHMGECGERCAETMGFDRAAQDAHATSSHARATAAE